jgi:hypothetical protein
MDYSNGYGSPFASTPGGGGDDYYDNRWHQFTRPQTRAGHTRRPSVSSPSPRYNSNGDYATVNVSARPRSRKHSYSGPRPGKHERRHSHSYYRASDHYGDSDEDEIFEINGVTYAIPARSKSRRYEEFYRQEKYARQPTDHYYYTQSGRGFERSTTWDSPRHEPEPRRTHSRRASTSMPQRPATARPASSHKRQSKAQSPTPATREATDADAKKHRIPQGYSLKNWDPEEEPITLLGSVFDANSLGKWIYDWTVYRHGAAQPISDMAGEMWLLLIQLAGKLKRGESTVPKIRNTESREMVEDFIRSGERLNDKLRKLLKACESPMLKASKTKKEQLGKNAGVEFVNTMFGRERELEKTERFMQQVRLWNLRFDANCEEVLQFPTA